MAEQAPDAVVEGLVRCLEGALTAMNQAIVLCEECGPVVAMEHIADYLNATDSGDAKVADDWLTRWTVGRGRR